MKKILLCVAFLFPPSAAQADTTVYVTNTSGVRSAMTLSETLTEKMTQVSGSPAANDCAGFSNTSGAITSAGAPCVTTARNINATLPILGGGALASDRTLSLSTTIGQNENFTSGIGVNTASGSQAGVLDVTSSGVATPDVVIHGVTSQSAGYLRIVDSVGNYLRNSVPVSGSDPRPRDCWYNTLETTPTNYEGGCVYFDNPNNVFRVEAQNGGTGTLRNLVLQGGGGRLGIGVIAPAVAVDASSLGTSAARFGRSSTQFFQLSGSAGSNTITSVSDTSGPLPWIFNQSITGGSGTSNTYWQYAVNGTEVARMTVNGAIGIGTGSSTQALLSMQANTSGNPALGSHVSITNNTFTDTVTAANGTAARYATVTYTAQVLAASNANVTTADAAIAAFSRPTTGGANQTITNTSAILVLTGVLGGTVTNSYVLKAAAATGATNNYAIGISSGNSGFGTLAPTAKVHLGAGTATAATAPLKFTSGTLLTTAEAGAEEFLTDKFYGTISTGAARKEFALFDAAGTSGRVPFETTNGRLTDVSGFTYNSGTSTLASPTINATTALQSNGTTILPVLTGTTASIGGGALSAGACASGTAAVSGATTAMAVSASPVSYPGDGAYWLAYVSASNTVTVKVCGAIAVTPTASAYNVRVIQ